MSSSPIFISWVPNLMGGEGHIIPYHQALGRALALLGWRHRVWAPIPPESFSLPPDWEGDLPPIDLEAEGNLLAKLARLLPAWRLGRVLGQKLAALPEGEIILFLERFIHLQLFALLIALNRVPVQKRRRLRLWILYRRDIHRDSTRPLYRWIQEKITELLEGRCVLLTDSEPLGEALGAYFQVPFTVLPIPHTDFPATVPLETLPPPIYCWWPGAPRPEKGWAQMQALARGSPPTGLDLRLLVAEAAQIEPAPGGPVLEILPNRLGAEEYVHWLNRCQLILLPYDALAYRERTSGIFTEAVIAGRLPLVTQGTWMAGELERYDLGELILDWAEPETVWLKMIEALDNPRILDKLSAMRSAYRQFHTLERFAEALRGLYDPALPCQDQ
ncbi:MAG: hypothetical protein GC158_06180 [Cyanobacteria bacterium RI_101]|nr:hypothetical protein [Cyanobacteria bacterium RI_101]